MTLKEVDKMIEVTAKKSSDISIQELKTVGMISVRGDLLNNRFQKIITNSCNLAVPKPLSINHNKYLSIAWMSPDELLILDYSESYLEKITEDFESLATSMETLVLDTSSSRCLFLINGSLWREVLAKGTPIDLRPTSFKRDSFRRTRMGQIAVAFWMVNEHSAHITCSSSHSSFFYDWLCNASTKDSLEKYF